MRSNKRQTHVANRMFLFTVFFLFLPSAVLTLLYFFGPNVVTSMGDAGVFISASTHHGGFGSPDVTNVQTTTGTVTIRDGFSANRGQLLVIRNSTKYGMQLCVANSSQKRCVAIEGPWTGSMQPVQRVRYWYAVPFASIGLGRGDLLAILMMTLLTTLAGLLTSSVEYMDNHPELRRTATTPTAPAQSL